MPDYAYRALNPRGRAQHGTLPAASPHDLHLQLQQAGMVLIESRVAGGGRRYALTRANNLRDLAQFCRHVAQLERASVRLTELLGEITASLPASPLQQSLRDVTRAVEGGATLSQSLARHPRQFRAPMPALVAAGEATGRLGDSFARLATHFEWQHRLSTRLSRTLAYPLFSLALMLAVMLFMLTTVIPETGKFLSSLDIVLPGHTRFLLALAEATRAYGLYALSALGTATAALIYARQHSAALAFQLDAALLRLPLLGPFLLQMDLARFTQNAAMMLQGGIDLLPALATATPVARNRSVRERLSVIGQQVESGTPLSMAARLSGLFPPLVQRMLRAGEEGGDLPAALNHVAGYCEDDAQHAAEILVGALGPAITIVTGGLLVWLVIAVFMPIYDALPRLM